MFDARELNNKLRGDVLEIVFTKANGEERSMLCTTMEEHLGELPADYHKTKTWDGDTLTVWDLEADGWRSFKASKVISVDVVE